MTINILSSFQIKKKYKLTDELTLIIIYILMSL